MIRSNTFEGGSDNVTISTGNSGGSSGDAFSAIFSTPTFEASRALHGSLGMDIAIPGTATAISARWSGLGSITGDIFLRAHIILDSLPGAPLRWGQFRTSAPALGLAMTVNASGKLAFLNSSSVTISSVTSATTMPTGSFFRVEVRSNPANGDVEWRYYSDPDSTTIDETKSTTAQTIGANTDAADFGQTSSGTLTNFNCGFDDVAVSDLGWLGPAVPPTELTEKGVWDPNLVGKAWF